MSVPYIENIRPAPREVSLLLRLQLLFGGALSQMGWFFFGFGMIFVWVFVPNCDWRSLGYIGAHLVYEQGEVYNVERTNFSVGGGKGRSGHPVYANYYRFGFGPDGDNAYAGVSYSTTMLYTGARVNIEYSQDDPALSRIEGMGNAPFSLWPAFFVMLFPGIGLTFMIIGINNGRKAIYLLRNGVLGYGKLESVNYANMQINNRNVYKFIFRYIGTNGLTYKFKTLTEQADLLQDEEAEQLLFDTSNQSNAVMLDTLPGGIAVDSGGNIRPRNSLSAISVSILPLIVVISQIAFIYYNFVI